jgi:hypothetical protein
MPSLCDLHRAHRRLQPLIEFARREGWDVVGRAGGSLLFAKANLPAIYSGAADDCRARCNAIAQLRCAVTSDSFAKGESGG